ncbi:glycosyl transferase [Achromatium sp. WMS2]|nr:glycosyl transferase [Achromatium sp. WMS2]
MHTEDYAITFACYNQLQYTKLCIESLLDTGVEPAKIVAVDNNSIDDTRSYLDSLNLGGCIFNKSNLGCGTAWNQGILKLQAEWTVIMNNDVVVTTGWLDGLLEIAQKHNLGICSPALIESEILDYNLASFAQDAAQRMQSVVHQGVSHAICMLVHSSVWQQVGYFRSMPRLLGYEDTLFFNEARATGINMGTTGAAWLHHFGSITQKAMKLERGLANTNELVDTRLKRAVRLPWWQRKLYKLRHKRRQRIWKAEELAKYGMTLHGIRQSGEFIWL